MTTYPQLGRNGEFCYRAMHMHKRGICRHAVSVRLSVTFVSCAKTNKDIFEIFPPSGSQAIVVFLCQTGWRCSDGNPPNGGVECKGVFPHKKWWGLYSTKCFPKDRRRLWRRGNLPLGDLMGKEELAQGSSNGLRTIHDLV